MQGFVEQLSSLLRLTSLDDNKDLQFIERKTGIKPSGFVIAVMIFLIIVTVISNATSLVVGIGCCCVPAYLTFVILEGDNRKALKKYLIYWITYAILELVGPALALLLPSMVYILLRIGIAVALLHPESTIAQKLFNDVIDPLLRKYEEEIDRGIEKAVEKGKEGVKKGKNYVQELIKK